MEQTLIQCVRESTDLRWPLQLLLSQQSKHPHLLAHPATNKEELNPLRSNMNLSIQGQDHTTQGQGQGQGHTNQSPAESSVARPSIKDERQGYTIKSPAVPSDTGSSTEDQDRITESQHISPQVEMHIVECIIRRLKRIRLYWFVNLEDLVEPGQGMDKLEVLSQSNMEYLKDRGIRAELEQVDTMRLPPFKHSQHWKARAPKLLNRSKCI